MVLISPRFFRKGPFNFTELLVVRLTARDKGQHRSGWFVMYIGRRQWKDICYGGMWQDVSAHWDEDVPD